MIQATVSLDGPAADHRLSLIGIRRGKMRELSRHILPSLCVGQKPRTRVDPSLEHRLQTSSSQRVAMTRLWTATRFSCAYESSIYRPCRGSLSFSTNMTYTEQAFRFKKTRKFGEEEMRIVKDYRNMEVRVKEREGCRKPVADPYVFSLASWF